MATGLLCDTPERDYAFKLQGFNKFAEPEIRRAIRSLDLKAGMRLLDAGCGTGEAIVWLHDAVAGEGTVVGMDLAAAHVIAARRIAPPDAIVVQADLLNAPLMPSSFDLVWCVNAIGHLGDPVAGAERLANLLRPGGRLALGQSAFLPDMFFAWDSRLERLTTEAVRQYYRERYGVQERELTGMRALLGLLRKVGLRDVTPNTYVIERFSPLSQTDRHYLYEVIFRGTWGDRLRSYLEADDFEVLVRICDPEHPEFALNRPDFHFLQTFTVVVGTA